MRQTLLRFSLIISGIAFMVSCEKEQPDTDTSAAVDNGVAESEFAQVFPTVNQIAVNEEGVEKGLIDTSCATVTINPIDSGVFPKTMTIDYGTGCTDADGRIRKGKITAVYSGKWKTTGSSITITLDEFSTETYSFKGTFTTTNNGGNSYKNTLVGGRLIGSGGEVKLDFDKTVTWSSGSATPAYPHDDEFSVTGTASGTNKKGEAYTSTIASALIKKSNCKYVSSGIVKIKPADKDEREINFGDGTCDNTAKVKIGDKSFDIKLD